MPRPSLCLNIPKTGSSFTSRFFDAADWLELRRRCGLGRLAAPNRASVEIVEADQALRAWLGKPHLPILGPPRRIRQPAVGPEAPSQALRLARPQGLVLFVLHLLHTTAMTDNLLSRAIRLLVGGDATAVRDRLPGEIPQGGCRSGLDREPVDGVRGLVHRDGSPRGHDE